DGGEGCDGGAGRRRRGPRRRLSPSALGRLCARGHAPIDRRANAGAARAIPRTPSTRAPTPHGRGHRRATIRPQEATEKLPQLLEAPSPPRGGGRGVRGVKGGIRGGGCGVRGGGSGAA